jgi:hypothetical protein
VTDALLKAEAERKAAAAAADRKAKEEADRKAAEKVDYEPNLDAPNITVNNDVHLKLPLCHPLTGSALVLHAVTGNTDLVRLLLSRGGEEHSKFAALLLSHLSAASVGDVVCHGKRVTAAEWIGALKHKPCAELLLSVMQSGNVAPPLWLHALYVRDMRLLKSLVMHDQAPGKRAMDGVCCMSCPDKRPRGCVTFIAWSNSDICLHHR